MHIEFEGRRIPVSQSRCTDKCNDPVRRSQYGGPSFALQLGKNRELVVERQYDSPFYNHPFLIRYYKLGWVHTVLGWLIAKNSLALASRSGQYRLTKARHGDTLQSFLTRTLRYCGTAWFDGVSEDPNQFNLGVLLGWYRKMEALKRPWLQITQAFVDNRGRWVPDSYITSALILDYFASMPPYDICSLNHQCKREDFDRMRNLAIASSDSEDLCHA